MAKLQSGNLTLEVMIGPLKYDWITYDVRFFWKDETIINNDILKRDGEWWGKRNYGTFIADDYKQDYLIETIRGVLESGESEYWEPIEPDVVMAIYPGKFFPFLKSHWKLVKDGDECEDEDYIRRDEQNESVKDEDECCVYKDKDDLFTIITLVDTYNLKDQKSYSGEGVSLHMIVTRGDLERFVTELEAEYCKK